MGRGFNCFIFKNGDREDLNNYRRIKPLNTIYEIRTVVLANRITPIMNYLTNDIQCACEKHKSAFGIIFHRKRNRIKNEDA